MEAEKVSRVKLSYHSDLIVGPNLELVYERSPYEL
jgi:hypothetical protein